MIDTSRQSGIIPDDLVRALRVVIVGAGAIGSHTAETLCKMGVNKFRIYDDDDVESHNIANQGFYLGDIGKPKVQALADRLGQGTGAEFFTHNEKLTPKSDLFEEDVVISAVDSMSARKIIWDNFLISDALYYIDGRMGARFGQVFFVDKSNEDHVKAYEDSMFDDSEAFVAPCSEKSTIFCAYGLSGFICATVAKIITKDDISTLVEVDFASPFLNRTV